MYDFLLKLKGKILFGKYKLLEINISNLLLYGNIHLFLFNEKILDDFVFLIFYDLEYGEEFIYKISKHNKDIIVSPINFKKNRINIDMFIQIFFNACKINSHINSNIEEKLYLIYYFFNNYIDKESFLNILKDKNSIKYLENVEPIIDTESLINKEKGYLYKSDKNFIKQSNNIVSKNMLWINSIHGISLLDFYINSLFLVKNGFIKKIKYFENQILYEMPYYIFVSKININDIVKILIKFNIKNYIGLKGGLKIGLIQEDPNRHNFINTHKGKYMVDFDSVTISYCILQPIYLFLDSILIDNYSNKQILNMFSFITKNFFSLDFFRNDFDRMGVKNIYKIYEKIYIYGYIQNKTWTGGVNHELKENFFKNNKKTIISILIGISQNHYKQ
ncbi:MAG: hypothetical protein QM490_02350 [Candidatus Gracilibacteria bacterium]